MQNKKNKGLQMLRGIIFISIIAFHCELPLSQMLWGGIESFFVISSYFLTKKLILTNDFKVLSKIKHRIKRLLPQYIFLLIFCILIYLIINRKMPISDFIYHILFVQNFNWMQTGYSSDLVSLTAHTWTLCIEIWLFILWVISFKCIKTKKHRIMYCFIMIVLALLYRNISLLLYNDVYITSLFPLSHADAFAAGSLMAICNNELEKRDYHNKFYFVMLIVGVGLLIASIISTSYEYNINFLEAYKLYDSSKYYLSNLFTANIYSAFTFISTALLFFSLSFSDHINNNLLIKLGDISYSGYLFHWPIVKIMSRFISSKFLLFIIVVGITFYLSLVFDALINRIKIKTDTN